MQLIKSLKKFLYDCDLFEPELRPAYVKKALKIQKEKPIKVGTIQELRKRFEK